MKKIKFLYRISFWFCLWLTRATHLNGVLVVAFREVNGKIEVLIINKRLGPPGTCGWHLPGGGINHKLEPREQAKIELKEESGIEISEQLRIVDQFRGPVPESKRFNLCTLWVVKVISQSEPKPSGGIEIKEAKFVDLKELGSWIPETELNYTVKAVARYSLLQQRVLSSSRD
ncbi:MAG: NUDIX hydrolase [Parcubacteria group bacterium]|nr:NUDIX hydrolase [Parcubacteria group bacterium]